MKRLKALKKIVENVTGVEDISSSRRYRPITHARYIYFAVAREKTNESVINIGKMVNKNHATTSHGYSKFQTLQFQLPELNEQYIHVKGLFKDYAERKKFSAKNYKQLMEKNERLEVSNLIQQDTIETLSSFKHDSSGLKQEVLNLLDGLEEEHLNPILNTLQSKVKMLKDSKRYQYFNDKRATA